MSSKQIAENRSSLALRLTIWYTAMFSLAAVVVFASCYFVVASVVQQRTDNGLLEDIDELRTLYRSEGPTALMEELEAEVVSDGNDKVFYRVFRTDGRLVLTTDMSAWPDVPSHREAVERLKTRTLPVVETLSSPEREYPARIAYGRLGGDEILQLGESLEDDDAVLAAVRTSFALTVPVILLVAGILGWLMARRALGGVVNVTEAAIDISRGDLSRRVPRTHSGDEVDQLAATFNQMLDRIQTLITGMREMTDNIAHDLRSPLARIRAVAEGALTSNPSMSDYRTVAADTIEECDRLMHLINTMLDITETEAGMADITVEPVDLGKVINDACDLFEPLAEDKNIALSCSAESAAIVHGNRHLLQRMLGNLIENALKYTPRGGNVSVILGRESTNIKLAVRDSGMGIADAEIDKVFDRFYRCEKSRSEAGSGLGLSLALAIARAHGGDITIQSKLGEGSQFTVTLPAAPT